MLDSVSNWNEIGKIIHGMRVSEIGRMATDGSIERCFGRPDKGTKEGLKNQISKGGLLLRIRSL